MKNRHNILFCLLLLAATNFCNSVVDSRDASSFPVPFWGKRRGSDTEIDVDADKQQEKQSNKGKDKKWSTFLTVDPSKIISTMMKHGGLLLPKSVEKDLDILAKVCHVEKAQLNVIERKMILHNFTLALPNDPYKCKALYIGRVYLHWDSYRSPCIEIEVDDVASTVEFTNLMLTKNNWNELKDFGFPPQFADSSATPAPTEESKNNNKKSADKKSESSSAGADTADYDPFVKFSSIDLSGNVTICLRSRPLDRDIGIFAWDLDTLDKLNSEITRKSNQNLAKFGRRGCTTNELYIIVKNYFQERLKETLKMALSDVSQTTQSMTDLVSQALDSTSETILGYANAAGLKKGKQLHEAVLSRLHPEIGKRFQTMEQSKETINAAAQLFNSTKLLAQRTGFFNLDGSS